VLRPLGEHYLPRPRLRELNQGPEKQTLQRARPDEVAWLVGCESDAGVAAKTAERLQLRSRGAEKKAQVPTQVSTVRHVVEWHAIINTTLGAASSPARPISHMCSELTCLRIL